MLVRKKVIGFRFHRAPNAGGAGMKPSMDQLKAFARSLGFQNYVLTVG